MGDLPTPPCGAGCTAVSDGPGALWRQIRYRSYGLVRGRYDGAGTAAPASEVTRHEFIGYQSEIETGLDYAYARFYDPELGQFLSHDPAGELPSPYAYTHGDPINFSDPSGQCVEAVSCIISAGIFIAQVAIAVYTTQVTINYARSGDWGFALDPGNAVTDPVPSQGGVSGLVGGPSLPNACNQGGIQVCNSLTIDPSTGAEMGIDLGAPELARLGAAIGAASGQGEESRGGSNWIASAADTAFRWLVFDYKDPFGGSYWLEAATLIPLGKVVKGAKLAERGRSVIGHAPDYLKRAEELGARRFNVPDEVWNRMSDAERWAANQKFLDRAIRRGDAFELATPLDKVKPGSYFEREIGYLFDQGYRVSPDGSRLLPP